MCKPWTSVVAWKMASAQKILTLHMNCAKILNRQIWIFYLFWIVKIRLRLWMHVNEILFSFFLITIYFNLWNSYICTSILLFIVLLYYNNVEQIHWIGEVFNRGWKKLKNVREICIIFFERMKLLVYSYCPD